MFKVARFIQGSEFHADGLRFQSGRSGSRVLGVQGFHLSVFCCRFKAEGFGSKCSRFRVSVQGFEGQD